MKSITFRYADLNVVDQHYFREGVRHVVSSLIFMSDYELDEILRAEPEIEVEFKTPPERWAFEAGRIYAKRGGAKK